MLRALIPCAPLIFSSTFSGAKRHPFPRHMHDNWFMFGSLRKARHCQIYFYIYTCMSRVTACALIRVCHKLFARSRAIR